jgi:protein tyrosine phosphatase (PTP) superfamily phosphohydrolase (DUF442 family)
LEVGLKVSRQREESFRTTILVNKIFALQSSFEHAFALRMLNFCQSGVRQTMLFAQASTIVYGASDR